jgi:hypothetical protein
MTMAKSQTVPSILGRYRTQGANTMTPRTSACRRSIYFGAATRLEESSDLVERVDFCGKAWLPARSLG